MIYLPPSYGSGENRYPVLYVHDLGDLFDPAYSNSLRSIEKLFSSQEVPELLLVGVAPKDRESEYTPFPKRHLLPNKREYGGKGNEYAAFFGQSAQASYRPALPNKSEP